jgi:hypothetical protein
VFYPVAGVVQAALAGLGLQLDRVDLKLVDETANFIGEQVFGGARKESSKNNFPILGRNVVPDYLHV